MARLRTLQALTVMMGIFFSQAISPVYSQTDVDNSCIQVTDPKLASLAGRQISEPRLGTELVISTTIVNNCSGQDQPFVVIIEVRRSDGITEHIGWQSGTISSITGHAKFDFSWIPDDLGIYELRSFAISDFENLSAVSRLTKTFVTVMNSINGSESSEPFTIVLIPDTQNYWRVGNEQMAYNQSEWIIENKEKLNIRLVIHLGDIVNTWNREDEWEKAENMIDRLDHNGVPFIALAGNHDFGNPYSSDEKRNFHYFDRFPESRLLSNQTLENEKITTDRPNMYTFLTIGKNDFMIVSMEYCPPLKIAMQVSEIIKQNPDIPVILATHAFLRSDGTWTSVSGGGICTKITGTDDYSTQAIWDLVVYPNPNVFLVVSGHSGGDNKRIDNNIAEKPVQQVVIDYQYKKNGGDGMLKIVRFEPEKDKIYFQTYSPWLDSYLSGTKNKFNFDYDMD